MNDLKTNRELLMELPEPYATQAINNAMRPEIKGLGSEWLDGTERYEPSLPEQCKTAYAPDKFIVLGSAFNWRKCQEGPEYWTRLTEREFPDYINERRTEFMKSGIEGFLKGFGLQ